MRAVVTAVVVATGLPPIHRQEDAPHQQQAGDGEDHQWRRSRSEEIQVIDRCDDGGLQDRRDADAMFTKIEDERAIELGQIRM